MPLHLLGKKSWNVYNADNIARVRRDEAAARDREEAAEQRMQEVDATRRLAILRGEIPPPLEPHEDHRDESAASNGDGPRVRPDRDAPGRRKRKRAGEDDTDFEMRLVREQVEAGAQATRAMKAGSTASFTPSTALVDEAGHISLFTAAALLPGAKNEQSERETARQRREAQDQYQMRFANATGKGGPGLTDGGPWYAKGGEGDAGVMDTESPLKNVWGNEDPGRKGRSVARLEASDPLAMMKVSATKTRELNKERRREAEERERETRQLRKEDRRREKRRREGRNQDKDDNDQGDDGLEGFSLDDPAGKNTVESREEGGRRHHRRHNPEDGRHGHRSHRQHHDRHHDSRRHRER